MRRLSARPRRDSSPASAPRRGSSQHAPPHAAPRVSRASRSASLPKDRRLALRLSLDLLISAEVRPVRARAPSPLRVRCVRPPRLPVGRGRSRPGVHCSMTFPEGTSIGPRSRLPASLGLACAAPRFLGLHRCSLRQLSAPEGCLPLPCVTPVTLPPERPQGSVQVICVPRVAGIPS